MKRFGFFFVWQWLMLSVTIFATPERIFLKEFIAHFPNQYRGFSLELQRRKQWTILETLDHSQKFPQTDSPSHSIFNSLGPVVQCPPQLLRSYGKGDGEKRVCGIMTNPCVVISIGSRNLWDFETDIVSKHPECKVHTFDCYFPGTVPSHLRHSVTSHKICIGPRNEIIQGKQFLNWSSLLNLTGTNLAPTALKMDIEGFEWTVLREMITSSPHHLLPLSISFELHIFTSVSDLIWHQRYRQQTEVALFMEYLIKYGYLLVDRHDNPYCPSCSEIVIARIPLASGSRKIDKDPISYTSTDIWPTHITNSTRIDSHTMNEIGKTQDTIPPRLAKLRDLVPNEEEVIYWLTTNDNFCGYFSYINRETSQSCPPFSYLFLCCNLFNLPCIYSDYKNNSQKLLMLTENSVILANIEEPACCCFAPSLRADISSWSDVKFIGSKQEFAKIQKERDPTASNSWENTFLTEPLDLLIIAKDKDSQKAMWLDFITHRSLRVDEIKGLKAQLKTKKANLKSRLNKKPSLEPVEERQSEVELSQIAIQSSEEKQEAI